MSGPVWCPVCLRDRDPVVCVACGADDDERMVRDEEREAGPEAEAEAAPDEG